VYDMCVEKDCTLVGLETTLCIKRADSVVQVARDDSDEYAGLTSEQHHPICSDFCYLVTEKVPHRKLDLATVRC